MVFDSLSLESQRYISKFIQNQLNHVSDLEPRNLPFQQVRHTEIVYVLSIKKSMEKYKRELEV